MAKGLQETRRFEARLAQIGAIGNRAGLQSFRFIPPIGAFESRYGAVMITIARVASL